MIKQSFAMLLIWLLLGTLSESRAATEYVAINNPTPSPPYTNWATAATNIQDAIDAAVAGDLVLVSNGVYQIGGRRVIASSMTNRVAVNKPLTVMSVNGPVVTTIVGHQVPGTTNGIGAVRCVYLTNSAVLAGFTLTNGATLSSFASSDGAGGGIQCQSGSAVVSNCIIAGNSAYFSGGGADGGTINNCTLSGNSTLNDGGGANQAYLNSCTLNGNSAQRGGGAFSSTLNNCSVSGNSAFNSGGGTCYGAQTNCTITANSAFFVGGGTFNSTPYNSILYYNDAPAGANFDSSTRLNYCCSTPLLHVADIGNIGAEPQLASVSHLGANSPCRGMGGSLPTQGTDIDGEAWLNPPSIGCDEYHSGSVTGLLSVAFTVSYTNVAAGLVVNFGAVIDGRVSGSTWDFGNGLLVTNKPYATNSWATPGDYPVVLRAWNETYPDGIAATTTVHIVTQPIHYVALGGNVPAMPYSSWATAATNIQDAVDIAIPGSLILVSNGVYRTGGRAVFGTMTNRLAVSKPLTVLSVNGAGSTMIVGHQAAGTTNGSTAVRCVYLTNGAVLAGFALTNGATLNSGEYAHGQFGGGVWCENAATISNCVITGNSAYQGGGVYLGTMNNCIVTGNSAAYKGGGVSAATLNNCTVIGNTASDSGGIYVGTLNNCIAYYNDAPTNANGSLLTLNYCCMTPFPGGTGNFTNAPLFSNQSLGDLHLQANSPCINAGLNGYAPGSFDLDGNPRIRGGTVDVGAYEFQSPATMTFRSWLQQYGLPVDGSADFMDSDADGMNNLQEWVAGTNPTNGASVLKLLSPSLSSGQVTLTWNSVTNRSYFVERSTDLGMGTPFLTLQTNIAGLPATTSYTDTNSTTSGTAYYRVGVQ